VEFASAAMTVVGGAPTKAASDSPQLEQTLAEASRALEDGDLAMAETRLREAIGDEPGNPNVPTRAGVPALRYHQGEMALRLLEPHLARYSDSAAFLRVLGTAYYHLGDYRSAQRALEQAVSLDNSSGLAYVLLGCTLEKLGNQSAAKASMEQARRLDP